MLNIYDFEHIADYNSSTNLSMINKGGIIFSYHQHLEKLFDRLRTINDKFVLLTYLIDNNLTKQLYDKKPKNVIWYSDNVCHQGVNILPLGVIYKKRGEMFTSKKNMKNANSYKTQLCFYGMRPDKNDERFNIYNQVKDFAVCAKQLPQADYYKQIGKSVFTFCPQGYGVDTWRFFEALYLGSIPVVRKSIISAFWKQYLNIFEYENVADITEQNLLDFVIKKENREVLTNEYWINKIKGELHNG